VKLTNLWTLETGAPLGQCRAVSVGLGSEGRGVLLVTGRDAVIDPSPGMFFFPKGTLSLTLIGPDGRPRWRRDLGPSVVPGVWFCPVLAFDLDGDGYDEIWWVANPDPDHPLREDGRELARLDARDGRELGRLPWPAPRTEEPMYKGYRYFLMGARDQGRPVLLTAQGTYAALAVQGWNADLSRRWEWVNDFTQRGTRGSHQSAVVDLDGDGTDELLYGEWLLSAADGRVKRCFDAGVYRGHSDIVQPFWDDARKRWLVFTCRESDPDVSPRVAVFAADGARLWGAVERGHMDMGWVARLGEDGEPWSYALRVGVKSAGPAGTQRTDREEFCFDAVSGRRLDPGFSLYATLPVDLDGDGRHELVAGLPEGDGRVVDRRGRLLGHVEGQAAAVGRLADHPGEQIVAWSPEGRVRLVADADATDSATMIARLADPFYVVNRSQSANGYNLVNLGGR
jgi:hypothetical protein